MMAEEKKVSAKTPAAAKKAPAEKKPAADKKSVADKKPAARKPSAKAAKPKVEIEVVKKAGAKKPDAEALAPAPKEIKKPAAAPKPEKAPKAKVARDTKNRTYATGKRKTSIARVWIMPGKGKIVVNGKESTAYFRRPVLQLLIEQPFDAAGRKGAYDVWATLAGGGLSGQAGALKHGVSRALSVAEPELRPLIKAAGFLTRDARIVERKHYGHKKARKSFQFSKR
jgi:small subunit ribosomal protein S9